jgi:WipA-like, phosphatase domain
MISENFMPSKKRKLHEAVSEQPDKTKNPKSLTPLAAQPTAVAIPPDMTPVASAAAISQWKIVTANTIPKTKTPAALKDKENKPQIIKIDIRKYPEKINSNYGEYTVGDLHGNGLFLLHFLIRIGIIQEISHEDYDWFVNFYNKYPDQISREDFERFNRIIDSTKVDNSKFVRFLGDIVADRGHNDYFVLKILHHLHLAVVKYEIILSNHGSEFIVMRQGGLFARDYDPITIKADHVNSCLMLFDAEKNNLIDGSKVKEFIDEAYLPKIKAVSYDKSNLGITVYTHAPVGVDMLIDLHEYVCPVPDAKFNYDDIDSLANSLESINKSVSTFIEKNNFLGEYIILSEESDEDEDDCEDTTVLKDFVWNRSPIELTHPDDLSISVDFVHGHQQFRSEQQINGVISLDRSLGKRVFDKETGKYKDNHIGELVFLCKKKIFSCEIVKPKESDFQLKLKFPIGDNRHEVYRIENICSISSKQQLENMLADKMIEKDLHTNVAEYSWQTIEAWQGQQQETMRLEANYGLFTPVQTETSAPPSPNAQMTTPKQHQTARFSI